jgi:hypothetical protein
MFLVGIVIGSVFTQVAVLLLGIVIAGVRSAFEKRTKTRNF